VKLTALCVFVLSLVVSLPAHAQKQLYWPKPPQPAESAAAVPRFPVRMNDLPKLKVVDAVQVQRDAKELLELSQSLQPDIDYVNRGLLPKDTLEKLKRIEKLSKHLRSQLAP
jgi:hypothetical protein